MAQIKRSIGMVLITALIFSMVASIAYAEDPPAENSADLTITLLESSQFPVAGQSLSCTIIIINKGTGVADNVSLTTLLPSIFLHPEFVIGGIKSPWGSPHDLGTINPGQRVELSIVGSIDSAAAGQTLSVTASVASSSADADPANNSATITRVVGEMADISINKMANSNIYQPGDLVMYSISYQNIGTSDSNNVFIEDVIPKELTNVTASINGGPPQIWNSPYSLGTLKPQDGGYIRILGTLSADAVGVISNTASIRASTHDAFPDDNAYTVEIQVVQPAPKSADIGVTKTADKSAVNIGETLSYTIKVENLGADDAQDVVLTDVVSDKLTNVEFSADNGATYAPWVSPYSIGAFASGASKVLLIRGTVASAASGVISNTATAASTTSDPNLSNNAASAETQINIPPAPIEPPPAQPTVPQTGNSSTDMILLCIMLAGVLIFTICLAIYKKKHS